MQTLVTRRHRFSAGLGCRGRRAPHAGQWSGVLTSYRRRDAGTWLFGFATGLAGDQIFYLALTWTAAQVLAPRQVGLLLVCGAVPRALVLLFGGVVVDRAGPKKVIILSDSARTLIMVGAAVLLVATTPGVLLLVVLTVVFGVVDGLFLPAVGAAPAFVAAPSTMARLQALRSLVYRGAPVVGAALGGWLVASGTVLSAFVVNAGLFASSVAALSVTRMVKPVETDAVPPVPEARPLRRRDLVTGVLREASDGLRATASDPFLRVAVVVVTLLDLGLAGPMTAGPALVASARGWGAGGVGAILAAMPAGAALCAAVLIARRPAARAGAAIVVGAAFTSLGLLGVGAAVLSGGPGALVLAVASSALVGVAVGLYGTMIHTALVQHGPPGQLGRIFALVALASYAGDPLSLAGTGVLEGVRPGSSFVVGGAVVAIAAILAGSSRQVRSLALGTRR